MSSFPNMQCNYASSKPNFNRSGRKYGRAPSHSVSNSFPSSNLNASFLNKKSFNFSYVGHSFFPRTNDKVLTANYCRRLTESTVAQILQA